jgi:hypothetical protein
MNLIAAWPRFMRKELAEEYVGGPTVLAAMEKQELIEPRIKGNRLTVYDRVDLDDACNKFKSLEGKS